MTSKPVRNITIKGGKVQTKPPRMPAGQKRNAFGKAKRLEMAWKAKSKAESNEVAKLRNALRVAYSLINGSQAPLGTEKWCDAVLEWSELPEVAASIMTVER